MVVKLEQFPILLGIAVALIGLTILLDAWQAGGVAPLRERRRRTRAVPHKAGQTLVVIGAIMNRAYLKEVLLFRGAARRGERAGEKNSRLNQTPPKTRIR